MDTLLGMVDHLRYSTKRLGGVASWIEFQNGLAGDKGVSHLHPLGNDDVADERAADAAEFVQGLTGMNRSWHFDRQYRRDPEPGVESLLDSLDGGEEAAEAPEGKETALGGYEDLGGGDKGVNGEHAQRGWTVYQNQVCPRLDRR